MNGPLEGVVTPTVRRVRWNLECWLLFRPPGLLSNRYGTCQHHNPLLAAENRSEPTPTIPTTATISSGYWLGERLHSSSASSFQPWLWMRSILALVLAVGDVLLWQQRVVSVRDAKKGGCFRIKWANSTKLCLKKIIRSSVFIRLMFLPFDIHHGASKHAWRPSASHMWQQQQHRYRGDPCVA